MHSISEVLQGARQRQSVCLRADVGEPLGQSQGPHRCPSKCWRERTLGAPPCAVFPQLENIAILAVIRRLEYFGLGAASGIGRQDCNVVQVNTSALALGGHQVRHRRDSQSMFELYDQGKRNNCRHSTGNTAAESQRSGSWAPVRGSCSLITPQPTPHRRAAGSRRAQHPHKDRTCVANMKRTSYSRAGD